MENKNLSCLLSNKPSNLIEKKPKIEIAKEWIISWVNYQKENWNTWIKMKIEKIEETLSLKNDFEEYLKELELSYLKFSSDDAKKSFETELKNYNQILWKEENVKKIEEELIQIMEDWFENIESTLLAA